MLIFSPVRMLVFGTGCTSHPPNAGAVEAQRALLPSSSPSCLSLSFSGCSEYPKGSGYAREWDVKAPDDGSSVFSAFCAEKSFYIFVCIKHHIRAGTLFNDSIAVRGVHGA
jgi:hypothetical protein